jgi:cytochrome c oxidase subunit II
MNSTPASIFSAQSPGAQAISHLFVLTLVICGAIFAVVAGLAVYNLIRFRGRAGDAEPRQIHGSKLLEIVWTVVPALILVVLFTLTVQAMQVSDPPATGSPDLVVIGHQWWWEIRYPASGVVTANEIHIPVGRPMLVQLDTVDVLHEFWVPQLARKMTAVPLGGNHIWLEADQPGTYEGICSEFCGTQHAWMRFQVIAESAGDYAAWERAQQSRATVAAGVAAQGREIFREMTCVNCHAIQGTASAGTAGPDLTHLAGRRFLGSRIVENTPANLRRWLQDPNQVKPGVKMPNFQLTDRQIDALVAYFETLR